MCNKYAKEIQNSPPIFNKILDLKANNTAEHKQPKKTQKYKQQGYADFCSKE